MALLKKFKVADNPRKFALFECFQEENKHSKLLLASVNSLFAVVW